MNTAHWQRTLIILLAQLREQAVLNESATETDPRLRTDAAVLREAARLVDDAEALVAAARLAPSRVSHTGDEVAAWVMEDLLARRRAGASDEELCALLQEPARGGLTVARAAGVVAGLSATS